MDNIAIATLKTSSIDWFYTQLKRKFNTKPLGEIKKILGIRITRDRKHKTIYLDQEEYINNILNRYGFTHEKSQPIKIPASDYTYLRPLTDEDTLINVIEYQ